MTIDLHETQINGVSSCDKLRSSDYHTLTVQRLTGCVVMDSERIQP